MIGNNETNFHQRLLLTDRHIASLCKVFTNESSANIKFSITPLTKITQSGGFLGRLLRPFIKAGLC